MQPSILEMIICNKYNIIMLDPIQADTFDNYSAKFLKLNHLQACGAYKQ